MPEARATSVPLDFESLSKKQKALVRKLAWETLKAEAPFVVVIPVIIGCLGTAVGILAGAVLSHLLFPENSFPMFLTCVLIGAGAGTWGGRVWIRRACRDHFRVIIREHQDEISQIGQR